MRTKHSPFHVNKSDLTKNPEYARSCSYIRKSLDRIRLSLKNRHFEYILESFRERFDYISTKFLNKNCLVRKYLYKCSARLICLRPALGIG
jgi:hypothetical protein